MKSITIHGLEDPLDALIRERAGQEGLSLNRTIKKLLAETLGLESNGQSTRENEFAEFCRVWSKEDVKEFNQNSCEFDIIDSEDWV